MYRKFNAGKRAHSLACLMVTTALWPLAAHAQQAGETIPLPTVEVTGAPGGEGVRNRRTIFGREKIRTSEMMVTKDGCTPMRSVPRGFISAILAALALSAVLCAAPILAQTAPPAQDAATVAPPIAASPEVAPAAGSAPTSPAEPRKGEPGTPVHITDALLPSALPRDLSPWGMFLTAVPIVQGVMVGLAIASLVTWTVWLAKTIELWRARQLARRGLAVLESAANLRAAEKKLAETPCAVADFAAAAAEEANRSKGLTADGVKDRAAALISRIEARAGRKIARGTGILATIGAMAVFVGLFGTVWGIMHCFIGISRTNTTNLAVVAPGIAEALLSTAMGLVAAIPAVVMYNSFARSITNYRALLGDVAAEVLRHLSRDLDRGSPALREGDAAIVPLRQSAE